MESLIHADIFFFITGVAVIVFACVSVVLVIYLVIISRDIRHIVRMVKTRAEELNEDVGRLRSVVATGGWSIFEWIQAFRNKKATSGKRKVATKE